MAAETLSLCESFTVDASRKTIWPYSISPVAPQTTLPQPQTAAATQRVIGQYSTFIRSKSAPKSVQVSPAKKHSDATQTYLKPSHPKLKTVKDGAQDRALSQMLSAHPPVYRAKFRLTYNTQKNAPVHLFPLFLASFSRFLFVIISSSLYLYCFLFLRHISATCDSLSSKIRV